jgi:DGQHR domain-containing protein
MKSAGGIQRVVSRRRVEEIAEYAKNADATFPTPILLALPENCYSFREDGTIDVVEGTCIADIVDGQHRVLGLDLSDLAKDFWVPVVFILEPTEEQKALIFATINGKQTKVPASLIYDLFGVTEKRSPQKTAHEVARAINSLPESPWYRRLKMLGTKTPGSSESLSQGTFVKHLLPLISANPVDDMNRIKTGLAPQRYPDCIFNSYFVEDKDATILKILLNVFTAVSRTWPREWADPAGSILSKSVGFTGIMLALPRIYGRGKTQENLSADYFTLVFKKAKERMAASGNALTSQFYSASSSGAGQLRDLLHEAVGQL